MATAQKILFLEPFFGGSHEAFARGLIEHSRHHIDLLTLPASFWKWRMRGAALHFIRKIADLGTYDGLITSDLMSLSDFKALAGGACPPALVYFHENQFSYPLAPGEQRDYQFGFTDITTALAADRIVFNSRFHHDAFFEGLAGFVKMMPDHQPRWVEKQIRAKACVHYPGCSFPAELQLESRALSAAPLIIWNHRWEFDKNPEAFFRALDRAAALGKRFRLALLGERCRTVPEVFTLACRRYGDRIVQYGYAADHSDYTAWLKKGDIVISTAIQENFGIAVVEAIRHGCLPLLPKRLSYPEIIPERFHPNVLYKDQGDLENRLLQLIDNVTAMDVMRRELARAMGIYAWENCIADYDETISTLKSVHPERST